MVPTHSSRNATDQRDARTSANSSETAGSWELLLFAPPPVLPTAMAAPTSSAILAVPVASSVAASTT